MRVLVTGATGVIGFPLINELCSRSYEVLVLASPSSPRNSSLASLASPLLRWQECALSDYELFTTSERFDAMIHMAWSGGMDRWNIDLNLHSARQCAMAVRLAARLGCHTFIGTGSQAECGLQTSPISGDTLCTPSTPFGAAKNLARDLSRMEASRVQGMRFIWARILSIYGPRDRETAMVTATLRKLIRGEMPQFSSGEQMWDFLYADDAARALVNMLELGLDGQIYVVGSGNARPLREYLASLLRPFCVELEQCLGKLNSNMAVEQLMGADTTTMQEHLGWAPLIDFDTGVRRTIEYCNSNPA